MSEDELRAELARHVREDRRRLFGTVANAVDKAPEGAKVSRGTWEKAESGVKIRDYSWASIEKRLGWRIGWAEEVLAGRASTKGSAGTWPPIPDYIERGEWSEEIDNAMADVDERFLALEERVGRIERRLIELGGDGDDDEQQPGSAAPTSGDREVVAKRSTTKRKG